MFFCPPPLWRNKALVLIDRTSGSNFGDMTARGGPNACFDGVTSGSDNAGDNSVARLAGARFGYVGKSLAAPRVFGRAIVYGSNDQGFKNNQNPTITLTIYGKTGSAPASRTDGSVIGTITFTDTANESAGRQIDSTDLTNAWDHIWCGIDASNTMNAVNFVEIVLYAWE